MTVRRRLIEVDLARLAPLSLDEQRRRMERLVLGKPRFSLQPMRGQFGDIMNVQPALFATIQLAEATTFEEIEKELRRRCRAGEEFSHNRECAELLHTHFVSLGIISFAQKFGTFPLGLERGVQFWVDAYYGADGEPVLTFIDPRGGSLRLTQVARDVVHSAMHAGIRERNADFAKARLQIIQLPYVESMGVSEGKKIRSIRVYPLSGEVKYDFAALDRMFTRTLNLWDEVCTASAEETKRRASGGPGGLI